MLVASASIHGHTRAAAHILAEKLRAKGAKVVEIDLTRTDVSYAVTEASAAARPCWPAPPMTASSSRRWRTCWPTSRPSFPEPHHRPDGERHLAPMAAKLMRAELDGMKNITVCDTVVTLRSASTPPLRRRWTHWWMSC